MIFPNRPLSKPLLLGRLALTWTHSLHLRLVSGLKQGRNSGFGPAKGQFGAWLPSVYSTMKSSKEEAL